MTRCARDFELDSGKRDRFLELIIDEKFERVITKTRNRKREIEGQRHPERSAGRRQRLVRVHRTEGAGNLREPVPVRVLIDQLDMMWLLCFGYIDQYAQADAD
jgi:hypothetical protein